MVVLQRVEDMNYANLLNIFGYAKEYEVVADRISALAYPSENGITAEFMRGGELLKVGIALFNPVRKTCCRLLVF